MNKAQKSKRNFRNSKAWKEFRKKIMHEQHGIDPITRSKLAKGCNLHHRHVTADEDDYKDMSNEEDFVMLNSMTHKMLHFLYTYWKKDPLILDRIEEEFKLWY